MITSAQIEELARRFAMYLRAPLSNASPFTTGGPPIIVPPKNGAGGTAIGQVNGLPLQGQTWCVTISSPDARAPDGGPLANGPWLPSARSWIFARISWAIGMAKHSADLDLPASNVSITLPFDVLSVSIVNDSPPGTDPTRETSPRFQLAVSTALAGRQQAEARRTISGTTPMSLAPPPFATSVVPAFQGPPNTNLAVTFVDDAGNEIARTTLSAAAPIQQPAPMLIPQGTAQIAVGSSNAQTFSLIFTLSF